MQASASQVFDSSVFRCKWTVPLIVGLSDGPRRFTDLMKDLSMSQKVLADKLDVLVRNGLVVGGDAGYVLTELGKSVADVLKPLTAVVEPVILAEVLKCKWSKEILLVLLRGAMYSSDVVAEVRGVSWKVASERLRRLVGFRLVARVVEFMEAPVRVRYELTPKGRLLASWLAAYVCNT